MTRIYRLYFWSNLSTGWKKCHQDHSVVLTIRNVYLYHSWLSVCRVTNVGACEKFRIFGYIHIVKVWERNWNLQFDDIISTRLLEPGGGMASHFMRYWTYQRVEDRLMELLVLNEYESHFLCEHLSPIRWGWSFDYYDTSTGTEKLDADSGMGEKKGQTLF